MFLAMARHGSARPARARAPLDSHTAIRRSKLRALPFDTISVEVKVLQTIPSTEIGVALAKGEAQTNSQREIN